MCSDHKFAPQLDRKELNTQVLFIRPVNLQAECFQIAMGSCNQSERHKTRLSLAAANGTSVKAAVATVFFLSKMRLKA